MFRDLCIKTNRILIRPFEMKDIDDFYAILCQEEVVKYLPEDIMEYEEVKQILGWLIGCYEQNTPKNIFKYTVAIVNKGNGKVIGWCGFGPLDFDRSQIELYYGLGKAYWGKGIATEASREIIKFAFNRVGIEKIVAVVNHENIGSVKVIENLGMVYVRKIEALESDFSFYEGEHFYELTKEVFHAVSKGFI